MASFAVLKQKHLKYRSPRRALQLCLTALEVQHKVAPFNLSCSRHVACSSCSCIHVLLAHHFSGFVIQFFHACSAAQKSVSFTSSHMALQDINNTATPMLMRDAIHRSYIPSMESLVETLRGTAQAVCFQHGWFIGVLYGRILNSVLLEAEGLAILQHPSTTSTHSQTILRLRLSCWMPERVQGSSLSGTCRCWQRPMGSRPRPPTWPRSSRPSEAREWQRAGFVLWGCLGWELVGS